MAHRTARWMTRAALPVVLTGLLTSTGLASAALAAPPEGEPWVKRAETASTAIYDSTLAAENDGWVVGRTMANDPYIAHWDGKELTKADLGDLENGNWVEGVDAVASDDVWAVSSGDKAYTRSHWDGKQWTHEAAEPPSGEGASDNINGVRAFASDDVWAIGQTSSGESILHTTSFVDHYDGSSWTRMDLPEVLTAEGGRVVDIDGNGPDDVWILATVATGSEGGQPDGSKPIVARWDGSAFTTTELPDEGGNWAPSNLTVLGDNAWLSGSNNDAKQPPNYKFDGKQWVEWKDAPLPDIQDMSAHPETGTLEAVGFGEGEYHHGEYATFDGNQWTNHPQADGVPADGPWYPTVAQAPESGQPIATWNVRPESGDDLSVLTSPGPVG